MSEEYETSPVSREHLYTYRVFLEREKDVYDGDTVKVTISLGFGVKLHKQRLRLFGINAPEMRGPEKVEGKKSRDYLRSQMMQEDIELYLVSHRDRGGKYGRWLATLWIYRDYGLWTNLNRAMVEEGFAVEAHY